MKRHAGFQLTCAAWLQAGHHASTGPARRKSNADQVATMMAAIVMRAIRRYLDAGDLESVGYVRRNSLSYVARKLDAGLTSLR